jgi:hypothetical protein
MFAVALESKAFDDRDEVRRIERQVAHEVFAEVDVRPRSVVVLAPGFHPENTVRQAPASPCALARRLGRILEDERFTKRCERPSQYVDRISPDS